MICNNSYGPVSEEWEEILFEVIFVLIATILTGFKLVWIARGTKEDPPATIDRVSWGMWSGLGVATLLPQLVEAEGWRCAMMFTCANLALNIIVLVWLGFKSPMRDLEARDAITFAVVAAGIVLWVVSGNALFGLVFSLLADALGVGRVLYKSYYEPESERALAWMFGAIAAVFATASAMLAGESIVLWYPAYVVLNASLIALVIVWRRRIDPSVRSIRPELRPKKSDDDDHDEGVTMDDVRDYALFVALARSLFR